jgi:NAD(P)-dependent dehydrogenase (short-subunit alcohol dehydrogenase family)
MVGKNAIPEYSAYNASKFSVIGITQSAALEFAAFDVNVNAVCPGIVRTPLWDTLDSALWDRQIERVPLRRGQTPEDVGHAVAFLASESAKNITGAALPVTGGLQMW